MKAGEARTWHIQRGIKRQESRRDNLTLTEKFKRLNDTRVKAHGKSTKIQGAKERKGPGKLSRQGEKLSQHEVQVQVTHPAGRAYIQNAHKSVCKF